MLFSVCDRSNMLFVLIPIAGDSDLFFYYKRSNFSVARLSTSKSIKMFIRSTRF